MAEHLSVDPALPLPGGTADRQVWWLIIAIPALEQVAEQGGEAGEVARAALADAAIMPLERELLRRYELDWIEQGAA